MAKYRIVGLPKAQRGSSGITGGPEYNSQYGMMGKFGYKNNFQLRDPKTKHTLSGDIYGGKFGVGASGSYRFGSEGDNPAFKFAQGTLGYDPVKGGYGNFTGGADIHLLNDRYKGKLDVTPYGGAWGQTNASEQSGDPNSLLSKVGLTYGLNMNYAKKFDHGKGQLDIYGRVSGSPSLGKMMGEEQAESGNIEFAPQFNIGAKYTLPLNSDSRKMKKLIAKQNADKNQTFPHPLPGRTSKASFQEGGQQAQLGIQTSITNYQQRAMELGAGMVISSNPTLAKEFVLEAEGSADNNYPQLRPTAATYETVRKNKQAATKERIDQSMINYGIKNYDPVLDDPAYATTPSETINKVATDYIGGPDLKTVTNNAMMKQQQDTEKKEAVAQHYYATRVQDEPNYTIEQARELVNNPGYQHNPTKINKFDASTTGKLLSNAWGAVNDASNIGGFAWEDYYNREGLGQSRTPDTMRGMTDAEWEAEHGEQSWQEKFTDIAYNPFTAAGFWARGQEVPDHMQRNMDRGSFGYYANGQFRTDRNPLDMITDVTALGAIHSADKIFERATNDVDGDFWTMETGLDAINSVFHANMLRNATKLGKTGSYYDDVMGSSTASRNATDPDLLNLGFSNPLQKTLGTTDEISNFVNNPRGFGPTQTKLLQRPVSPAAPAPPAKPSWSLMDPSTNTLQIKSTMKGSPFEKQLSKTGQISVNNIKAHMNKEGVGMQDKYILQKTLDENFPGQTKIDYNEFKAAVSGQIVPLEKTIATGDQTKSLTTWGLDRLGYKGETKEVMETLIAQQDGQIQGFNAQIKKLDDKIASIDPNAEGLGSLGELAKSNLEDLQIQKQWLEEQRGYYEVRKNNYITERDGSGTPLVNESVVYSNFDEFGSGNNEHWNKDGALGHARTLVSKEEPDIMHILESQSDYYQKSQKKLKADPYNLDGLTKAERILNNKKSNVNDAKAYYEKIKSMHAEGKTDLQGQPVYQYQIDDAKQRLSEMELEFKTANSNSKNAIQKRLLGKTHEERLLQENILHAVEQGQSKMRYPTAETAVKIQGYKPIKSGTGENDVNPADDQYWVGKYHPSQQTILKKYDNFPKMAKKTIGQKTTIVTDAKGNTWYEFDIPDDALFGKYEMKSLSAEDWINKNGPGLTKRFTDKFKRKSTKTKETEVAKESSTGTHEERAVQNIINDVIKDMPFQGVKQHPFAGSNLMEPLNIQTGVNTPIYTLPGGVSQMQLDSFVSQINAGEVSVTSIEAVFNSIAKLNPELNTIKGVPKGDILGYMSGHMPVDQIESTHMFMNQQPNAGGWFPTSGKNLDETVATWGDKFQNFTQNVNAFTRELSGSIKGGTNKAAEEANKWLNDWIEAPATQEKISKMFDKERGYASEEAADKIPLIENQLMMSQSMDLSNMSKADIKTRDAWVKRLNVELNEAKRLVAGEPGDVELEALNFKPNTATYPLGKQLSDLISGTPPIHIDNLGVSYTGGPRKGAWLSRAGSKSLDATDKKLFTGIHEAVHQWTKANKGLLATGELEIVKTNMKQKAWTLVKAWQKARNEGLNPEDVLGDGAAYYGYLGNPTEVHARVMELRKHFDLKPDMEITPDMAQNMITEIAKGTTPVAKMFSNLFEDAGSFANIFNGLRVVAPIVGIAGAAAASQEQDGGFIEMELTDKEIAEYKKGGYIVDEM